MRLYDIGTIHLTQNGDDFLGQSDLLSDRPVVLEKENVDIEVAGLDAPNKTADYLVEICETLKHWKQLLVKVLTTFTTDSQANI